MDKNSIIGFVLLVLLGGGYIFYNNYESEKYQEYRKQVVADSLEKVEQMLPAAPPTTPEGDSLNLLDTVQNAFQGRASIVSLHNEKIKLDFSTQGGYPVAAALDSFTTYHGKDSLYLFNGQENELSFELPYEGKILTTKNLYFQPESTTTASGDQQLRMVSDLGGGKQIILEYTLPKESYVMKANFRAIGFQNELSKASEIPMTWVTKAERTEKDVTNERLNFQNHFTFADGDHDYFTIERTNEETLEESVKWFGVRTHFFNSTIIADQTFKNGNYVGTINKEDTTHIGINKTTLNIASQASNDFSFGFQWLISPNQYKLLKSFDLGLDEMVQLGVGPFAFVKYISKWLIIPLFDFLSQFTTSFGWIIILMTIIIRLVLSFFTYKSQKSTAKMRVLKPEIDALKAKYGDNQQQIGIEQMKLYKSAGVNPMGGCLPMLLQMPFLLAMYYFFPNAIGLRQSEFLWSNDLSTYDSIMDLPFKIPFYGDHISLFTILMAATSFFLAFYSQKSNPAGAEMNNPMIKYMPFIMPLMFLPWFNNMAAGLTFYYTLSNIFSILQQFVIQKFLIDEDKILKQINENKLKPKNTTSKWQQRLEQMQKMQAEQMKQKK